MDVLSDDFNHHDSLLSLESGLDPLNPGSHGHQVVVSPQTGLPPVNPNNPPPPPPSGGSNGPSAVQGPIDIIQIQPPPAQMSHQPQHGGIVYPMPNPHSAGIPYGAAPYAQVPFIPAFNPVPGNYVYQGVIYQVFILLHKISDSYYPFYPSYTQLRNATCIIFGHFSSYIFRKKLQPNTQHGGAGVTTSSSNNYYNPQQPPQGGQQNQVGPAQFGNPMHSQHAHHAHGHNHSHAMVNPGAALQYYPPVPISTSAPSNPHTHLNIRPAPAQYFPVTHSHMSVMNSQIGVNHHHGSNVVGVTQCSGPQVAVVTPVPAHSVTVNGTLGIAGVQMTGHVQHMSPANQHHAVSMNNSSHLMAITNASGSQNGMPQQSGQQGPMVLAPNGHPGQLSSGGVAPNSQILLPPNGHTISQGNIQQMINRQSGQPQVIHFDEINDYCDI